MRVLVTGATGFVGSNLIRRLSEEDIEVFAVDQNSLPAGLTDLEKNGRLHFFVGDIVDYDSMAMIISDARLDYIFHVAAFIPGEPDAARDRCLKVNIEGTQNILEASKNSSTRGVILSSTCDIYGQQDDFPISEKAEIRIRNFYSLSKYCAELYAKQYYTKFGVNLIILRYAGIYGPGKETGVVSNFINNVIKNLPPRIDNDGSKTKDLIHVYDVVEANILALKKIEQIGLDIFNISSNEEISLRNLAEKIIGLASSNLVPVYVEKTLKERQVFDNSKARKMLGFKTMSLDEGIRQFIDWKKKVVRIEKDPQH
jgi:UDP-glucose 4-epimerase